MCVLPTPVWRSRMIVCAAKTAPFSFAPQGRRAGWCHARRSCVGGCAGMPKASHRECRAPSGRRRNIDHPPHRAVPKPDAIAYPRCSLAGVGMRRRDFIGLLGGTAAWPLGVSTWAESAPVAAALPAEPSAAERAAMVEAAMAFMQRYAVPGFSVAVGHSGRLIYQDAFGWADREAREAATPAHLFRIASISKSITSVSVFTLIEEGRLSLSDRVFGRGGVLGAEYGQPSYPAMVEEITIEHLLTHTGGGWSNQDHDPMFNNRQMNHAQLIDWTLRNRPLENPPGRVYAYS